MSQQIGFTGTQLGLTEAQSAVLRKLLGLSKGATLHHGDCIGADAQAHDIAVELGLRIAIHPPIDPKKRAFKRTGYVLIHLTADYRQRNTAIVNASDTMIACPKSFDEEQRSGTWMTIRIARRAAKPIIIIWPDGSLG